MVPDGYGSGGGVMVPVEYVTTPPREQTDTCENVTFPQLRLRAVKTK